MTWWWRWRPSRGKPAVDPGLIQDGEIVNNIIITIISLTRSYAALRAADLDWIVGPGYSLGRGHSGEKTWKTNLEPWQTNLEPWKTMETNQKPWKTMKLPWKTMETNQKPWKFQKKKLKKKFFQKKISKKNFQKKFQKKISKKFPKKISSSWR